MKFFLDTADVDAIRELNELGMVDGVTTNPSLILKAGRNIEEVTAEICAMVEGPVSAEVVAESAEDMIREGRHLAKIAKNIAIKVPLTWDGLKACRALTLNVAANARYQPPRRPLKRAVYRKAHLWNLEKLWFSPGNLGFPVFETPIGRIGLMICWDVWFPEVPRLLSLQGADIICSLNNWVWTPPPLFDETGN